MSISNEQLLKVKEQLIEQIKNTFPEDKKGPALDQIELMDDSQLAQFLEQNNLLKDSSDSSSQEPEGIFRAIVAGQIPSTKIAEDNSAIAVLEINPLSKGHTIIIPKNPVTQEKDLSKELISFVEKVSKNLKEKLKAKSVTTSNSNDFGELIINLIPIYGDSKKLEKYRAEKSELEEVENSFLKKLGAEGKEKKETKKQKPLTKKDYWLPKRIP